MEKTEMKMNYEKKYNEALKRAKAAIDIAADKDLVKGVATTIFPELRESEDERIRKEIIEYLGLVGKGDGDYAQPMIDRWIAYLEKQKGKMTAEEFESSELFQLKLKTKYANGYQDGLAQKEQKPAERSLEDDHIIGFVYDLLNEIEWKDSWAMSKDECLRLLGNYSPQKSAWSEEDEKIAKEIEEELWYPGDFPDYPSKEENELYDDCQRRLNWFKNKIKSIRPQSIQLKEAYKDGFQTARDAIALAFMNYLDENRPDGKMCLSNGECEEIKKAFFVGDWAKIMRYYEKYRPHWKPSEEQMNLLLNIEGILRERLQYVKATQLAELYEQLKKLM